VIYSLLGLVFGLAGKSLVLAGLQRSLSIILGVTLLACLLSPRRLALSKPLIALVGQLKGRMTAMLRRRTLVSLVMLGLLNGLLPCGLVYAACAGAASTGTLLRGMQYMAIFGLGTLPTMLAISLSGKWIPPRLRLKLSRAVPIAGFALAALLILRGLSLGIPYLSPDLGSETGCCHPARP
jgi:sulfite exporter TauE/SafE